MFQLCQSFEICKFANDSKMFGTVNNNSEHIIEKDLDTLRFRQIGFNVLKCKVMHLGSHNNKKLIRS